MRAHEETGLYGRTHLAEDSTKNTLLVSAARTAEADLTPEEKDALAMYATGDPSSPHKGTDAFTAVKINTGLRNGEETLPDDIASLDSAIAKGKFDSGVADEGLVYRVVPDSAIGHLKVGDVFTDPAYVSTAWDLKQTEAPKKAAKSAGQKPVTMRILVPNGYPGIATGAGYDVSNDKYGYVLGRQSEWLLPRDTQFRVLDKKGDKITLEVVVPDESAATPA